MSNLREGQATDDGATERLAKTVNRQTEWLVLRFQGVFQRRSNHGNVVYMNTDIEQALSTKTVRKISVVLFLFSVSSLALGLGFYYTVIWKPCPKNFFYKSIQPCRLGCTDKEFTWNKTVWYDFATSYCGNKKVNCTVDAKPITNTNYRNISGTYTPGSENGLSNRTNDFEVNMF